MYWLVYVYSSDIFFLIWKLVWYVPFLNNWENTYHKARIKQFRNKWCCVPCFTVLHWRNKMLVFISFFQTYILLQCPLGSSKFKTSISSNVHMQKKILTVMQIKKIKYIFCMKHVQHKGYFYDCTTVWLLFARNCLRVIENEKNMGVLVMLVTIF